MVARDKLADRMGWIVFAGIVLVVVLRPLSYTLLLSITRPDLSVDVYVSLLDSWSNELVEFLILITALIYLAKLVVSPNRIIARTSLDLPLCGLLIASLASMSYSVNQDLTRRTLLNLLSWVACFYLVAHNVNSAARLKGLVRLLIGVAVVISGYGIFQHFFTYGYITRYLDISVLKGAQIILSSKRVTSLIGWPTMLAGFLGLMIPLSATVSVFERRKWFRALMVCLTCVMLVCMFFTYSICGWLALGLGSAFGIMFFFRSTRSSVTDKKWALLVITAILVILLIGGMVVGKSIIERRTFANIAGSLEGRQVQWKAAVEIIKANPFLGTGLGTFRLVYPRYMGAERFYTWHAHNMYLEMLSEIGIFGSALFFIFIGVVVGSCVRLMKVAEGRYHRLLAVGLTCSIIGFLIHNMIDFTFYYPQVSIYWWIIGGLLIASSKGKVRGYRGAEYLKDKPRAKLYFFLVGMVILIMAIVSLCKVFIGDVYFYKGIRCARAGELRNSIEELQLARSYNSLDSRYLSGLGEVYYLLSAPEERPGAFIALSLESYKEALKLNPYDAGLHAKLGKIYLKLGHLEEAIAAYEKALFYHPAREEYRQDLERLYSISAER